MLFYFAQSQLLEGVGRRLKDHQPYVYTPKLFYRLKGDDLLQQIIPVVALATGRLGEPQCPPVCKRVLDVEVVLVMKDGLDL